MGRRRRGKQGNKQILHGTAPSGFRWYGGMVAPAKLANLFYQFHSTAKISPCQQKI
jgi:hypothetical protein